LKNYSASAMPTFLHPPSSLAFSPRRRRNVPGIFENNCGWIGAMANQKKVNVQKPAPSPRGEKAGMRAQI
jgi:hypothetical protein